MNRAQRGSLASHATLSLSAGVLSAVVTLATLPYIVDGLGLAVYGLFALLSLASAYVGVLDLGFSWTTSRFVADALGREDHQMLDDVLGASLVLYVVVGSFGGGVLALAAPVLVEDVFNVPPDLRRPGALAGQIFGLAFPAAMAQTYASAVLRGAQRFDLTAVLQAGTAMGTSAGLVAAVAAGAGIVGVTATVAGVQCVAAALGLAAARWVLPGALRFRRPKRRTLTLLGGFSAKVAVTNLGMQLLYLPNRLAVGILLPLAAVGNFTVPFALAQRLQMVPAALASAGLPTLTGATARGEATAFKTTFWRLLAANGALLLPATALVVVWAPTFLEIWFSSALSENASMVLRISVVAVLLNAGTSVLAVACDSAGKPEVPALATAIAGIANVGLAFALTAAWGIVGSAVALLASLGLLVGAIIVLWRRHSLPRLDRPPFHPGPRLVAGGVLAILIWGASAWFTEPIVDDRPSLVVWICVFVGTAYIGVGAAVGRDRLARLLPNREAGARE
ncbi:MAG TPA: polysaccharide biosynthesis C-terminal domain-containing protein [Solirubrobacteraceae bacterium]|nr:polysaccharide biosynthesis C-terminal domain-containing protein [Solirubrobacteraceae bacterium]